MKVKILLALLAIFALVLAGCKKELVPPPIHDPYIISVKATPSSVSNGGATSVLCVAVDPDKNALTYTWTAAAGQFYTDTTFSEVNNTANPVVWRAPETSGVYTISVKVEDGADGKAEASTEVQVGDYKLLSVLGQGVLSEPMGVYVEPSGEVWVADAAANKVYSYDGVNWSSFSFAGTDTSVDTTVTIDTTVVPHETTTVIDTTVDTLAFDTPMDVELSGGLIYVLDSGANKIHKYSSPDPGGYMGSIVPVSGSPSYPPTGFTVIDSFAYAATGLLGVRRIHLTTGAATGYSGPRGARDIAFNGADRYWVTIYETQGRYFLKEYALDFTLVSTIQDSVYAPWGLALAPSGSIFVSQWGNEMDTLNTPQCHIAEFSPSGSFSGRWGDTGGGREGFNSPAGLWITADGKIYVCDRGNGVVKVFGSN